MAGQNGGARNSKGLHQVVSEGVRFLRLHQKAVFGAGKAGQVAFLRSKELHGRSRAVRGEAAFRVKSLTIVGKGGQVGQAQQEGLTPGVSEVVPAWQRLDSDRNSTRPNSPSPLS